MFVRKNVADKNSYLYLQHFFLIQVTATDGDKDRQQNIVYFLTGQGIDPDNPANSKFDINRTTGEIFVLKVSGYWKTLILVKRSRLLCLVTYSENIGKVATISAWDMSSCS